MKKIKKRKYQLGGLEGLFGANGNPLTIDPAAQSSSQLNFQEMLSQIPNQLVSRTPQQLQQDTNSAFRGLPQQRQTGNFFDYFNPLAYLTTTIANSIGDARERKQYNEDWIEARQNRYNYNKNEQGLDNIAAYFEKGGSNEPSPAKAKEMLRDGKANGKKLTNKQKRYFGYLAGKDKKQIGGEVLEMDQELDLTPEQVEYYQSLGYDFEII